MEIKDALFLFVLDAFHQVPRGAQTPSQGKKHGRMHPADFERISKFFLLSDQSYWDALPVAAIDDVRVKKEREKTAGTHGGQPFSSHLFCLSVHSAFYFLFQRRRREKSSAWTGDWTSPCGPIACLALMAESPKFFDAIIGFLLASSIWNHFPE